MPAPAAPTRRAYAAGQRRLRRSTTGGTLRQSSGYRFADYARFLIANPDWPDEAKLRGWAEKAMQPGENAGDRPRLLRRPTSRQTGNGWARLADAYARDAGGWPRRSTPRARPGRSADLSATDEQAIWAATAAASPRADHDDRVDALLFAKKADDAARFLSDDQPGAPGGLRGADRDAAADAPDAEARYQAVIGQVTRDAGLMMDRARYLRANNYDQAAQRARRPRPQFRLPAGRSRALLRHADPARGRRRAGPAMADGLQHREPDRRRAARRARASADQPIGIRDNYTTPRLARRDASRSTG